MHPVCINPEVGRLHHDARWNAEKGTSARNSLAFYTQHRDIEPYTPLHKLNATKDHCGRQEGDCLRVMNQILFDAGLAAGQTIEIEGHLYRVFSYGAPCVHLGQVPPSDEIAVDAADALDDATNHLSEVKEWNSEYIRSIAVN